MGGSSKKGGGVSAPEVTSNPRFAGNSTLWQQEQGLQNLTSFEQSLINPQVSQANWATDIATGNNTAAFSPETSAYLPYGQGTSDPGHQAAGYGNSAAGGGSSDPFFSFPGQSSSMQGTGVVGSQSATPGAQSSYNTQTGPN